MAILVVTLYCWYQGHIKRDKFGFRNLYFYFQHEESTSTASQLNTPASQKSKDLNFKQSFALFTSPWLVHSEPIFVKFGAVILVVTLYLPTVIWTFGQLDRQFSPMA